MNDENKKLEACGDGVLLAVARLYLKERHAGLPYTAWTRLTARLVNNRTLTRIATAEGFQGAADGFEREIARRLYRDGFAGVRAWLWRLFDRHVDMAEEARQILDPAERDRLARLIRGALKNSLQSNGGKITEHGIEGATKLLVNCLMLSAKGE